MHHPLKNTFDALEVYIQSQKALLARTQSDVDRLRLLREQAAADPEHFFDAFDDKLDDNVFHFDREPEIAAEVQDKIDWDLFKGQDPTPLRSFAADLRAVQYARSQPSLTQQSALSSAQQLVRNARRSIIEPVLASFDLSSDSSSDGEQQLAPDPAREKEQLRRIRLRNKGGLTLRASGVHVRRDIGDESADVDIASTDGALISLPSAEPSQSKIHSPRPTPRFRRPVPTRTPATTAKAKIRSETEKCTPPMLPPTAKKEKPKSETYKQAWSVSEQHLLERLLSEIPDGEKNRWSKISKSMGGRRTPRQVASRVQKYFEKLKLFGVNVERG
jgi:hypothetical protein